MIRKAFYLVLVTIIGIFGCKQHTSLTAEEIINKSIEVSGGNIISNSSIDFNFRDIHYTAYRNDGIFELGRNFVKDNDTIVDWLTNIGFQRTVNRKLIKVVDSMIPRYSASVNSVHYFSVLPYGLNDSSVNKTYIGKVEIKDKMYHKIKVTFSEEGGGEDFEDVFIYFIDSNTYKVTYLAYSYNEDDGLGLRFREAYNERFVKRIRFVDYYNFKPKNEKESLDNLEVLFENNGLVLLSKIELQNINVSLAQL